LKLIKASVHVFIFSMFFHTATIGIQADNTVINGEDFTIDSTPVSCNINNDPLIVPMNNDLDLFVSLNDELQQLFLDFYVLLPAPFQRHHKVVAA
jgi:hypothetical protein